MSQGGFKTPREAKAGFAVFRDEVRKGGHVDTYRGRLGEYLVDEWLPAIKASVKESTPAHSALNAMYADLLADGRADGTGWLAPTSVKAIRCPPDGYDNGCRGVLYNAYTQPYDDTGADTVHRRRIGADR